MHLRRLLTAVFALSVSALAAAGCAADPATEEDEAYANDESSIDEGPDSEDEVGSTSSDLGSCNQCNNCVSYARCRQPRLPTGLTSYADKRAKINRSTAKAGCVAVINTGSYYGHVAYVTKVSGGKVHIAEGNWPSGRCGSRSGTKAALNITGYICP